jgi:hypothetical protein
MSPAVVKGGVDGKELRQRISVRFSDGIAPASHYALTSFLKSAARQARRIKHLSKFKSHRLPGLL